MADFLKNFIGGAQQKPIQSQAADDADFADFASAPEPAPLPKFDDAATGVAVDNAIPTAANGYIPLHQRPFTKWYRVWERVYLEDFYSEMFIIPFMLTVIFIHLWGTRKNRRKAQSWIAAHAPVLHNEFAVVGFGQRRVETVTIDSTALKIPEELLKEKSAHEYISYATGRKNIAFMDIRLSLHKRYNPLSRLAEEILGFFFEGQPSPTERMEATSYVFDGREIETLEMAGRTEFPSEKFHSAFDGFVWGVVHKTLMNRFRSDRYDLSLTSNKDNPKLPPWATVMSESAEITEMLLTPDFIKALNEVGDEFESLIISDQPIDKPRTLNEIAAKKRITLSVRVPSSTTPSASSFAHQVPVFNHFIRLADFLAINAHFRPEVSRRIKATREEEVKKIKKAGEGEKVEERRLAAEKEKKKIRDEKLSKMNADEQRKFLERERAAEMRRGMKKQSVRG